MTLHPHFDENRNMNVLLDDMIVLSHKKRTALDQYNRYD